MNPEPEPTTTITGGGVVAAGMLVMNFAAYGFTIVAARVLVPRDFGAVTALLGIILVGNVMSLGLQATTARRLATRPQDTDAIINTTTRVAFLLATGVGVLATISTFVVTPLLRLDSYWPVALCGATLVPLTVMGAEAGIAQGTSHWRHLAAIYAGVGMGRVILGTVAMMLNPSVEAAMAGTAAGAIVPALIGSGLLRFGSPNRSWWRRDFTREAILGTHALLAYFVLSNIDAIVARNLLTESNSGLYAAGLIISKAALFFPQFVSVLFFPTLARARDKNARLRAVTLVAGFGVLAVASTALLPQVALILVGGGPYEQIATRLWLFALSGSLLAVVHLLVFDALARHAPGVVIVVWLAVIALVSSAYILELGITGLIVAVAVVAGCLAVIVWFVPVPTRSSGTDSPAM